MQYNDKPLLCIILLDNNLVIRTEMNVVTEELIVQETPVK